MTTDFQQGRIALGQRLRELRRDAGLTVRQLAQACGWAPSKVSKLENAKQTATPADLELWAAGVRRPETAEELKGRLRGLESAYRSWRRQLAAGHRPVQDALNAEYERSMVLRAWEDAMVVGVLQTADYARAVFSAYADLQQSVRDVEDAVRARLRRQETLYRPGRRYRIVMGESALLARVCPPSVLAAQLDRLSGVIGLDTVELGIVPLAARMRIPPANGFWVYDERLVIVEDWHAELWLDSADDVALYLRVWDTLNESAVYGAQAHRLITRARAQLDVP
ncbi:helix-turn-helix domain-containing protein [Actinacidiphila acididurans]|uniref:Helix-turn-helix transcriptional regulator n=1 Tax=Actinacidiphila acididurans TaxID=2784346 RepID=A0ABS2TQX4_9ACTN|nr:helix-turn-helix transcriptional regulator [Actinacidiphila acididurans]MBM9505396.1 helix-turn-helix transcriptional regulator [Actinacidiphila acididurans]